MAKSFLNKTRNLKQIEDIWEVSIRPANAWVDSAYGGDPYRPWHVLVISQKDIIIQHGLFPKRPTLHETAEVLYKGMVRPFPSAGRKHRPTKVLVNDADLYEKLSPELDSINVVCKKHKNLSFSNAAYKALATQFEEEKSNDIPSLATISGLTIPALEKFYEASASYYEAAPWKKLPQEEFAIEIQYPHDAKPRYAIIIGRAGESFGLSVNDTWEDLEHFYASSQGLTYTEGKYSVISCTYEKEHFLTFEDLDSIEKYNWKIPSKDAYPSVLRAKPTQREILPLKKNDIFWLSGVLSALAKYFGDEFDTENFLDNFGAKKYSTEIEIEGLSGTEKVRIKLPILLF